MHIVDSYIARPQPLRSPSANKVSTAPEIPTDSSALSALSAIAECPSAPSISSQARSLAKQGKSLAEQMALQAPVGPAAAPAARQLEQFRQGICPYLSQMAKSAPADQDWSALTLLSQELQKAQLDPVDFFQETRKAYGDSFQIGDVRVETRPDIVQQILVGTDNPKAELARFRKSAFQTESLATSYGHDNIFVAGEDTWKRRREMMNPFFTAEAVFNKEVHGHILSTVNRHLDAWAQTPEVLHGKPLDLGARLPQLTLDSALHHMFSVDLTPAELEQTANTFKKVGHQVADSMLGRSSAADPAVEKELDAFAARILDGRQRGQGKNDLLQALLDSPVGLDKTALRNEIVTMALLGHETTANLLGWSLSELTNNPQQLQAFRQEVAQGGPPSLEQARKLKGAADVVRETARLHPPNYLLTREAIQDVTLNGPEGEFKIAAGTQILMPLSVVNQEAAKGKEPEAWLPQREGTKMLSFGGGHRVCLGQVFARLEANVVLSEIVRRFDIQPATAGVPGPHTQFSSAPSQEQFLLAKR